MSRPSNSISVCRIRKVDISDGVIIRIVLTGLVRTLVHRVASQSRMRTGRARVWPINPRRLFSLSNACPVRINRSHDSITSTLHVQPAPRNTRSGWHATP